MAAARLDCRKAFLATGWVNFHLCTCTKGHGILLLIPACLSHFLDDDDISLQLCFIYVKYCFIYPFSVILFICRINDKPTSKECYTCISMVSSEPITIHTLLLYCVSCQYLLVHCLNFCWLVLHLHFV